MSNLLPLAAVRSYFWKAVLRRMKRLLSSIVIKGLDIVPFPVQLVHKNFGDIIITLRQSFSIYLIVRNVKLEITT